MATTVVVNGDVIDKSQRPQLTSAEINDAMALVDECLADKNMTRRPSSQQLPAFAVTPTESPVTDPVLSEEPTESPAPPEYPVPVYNNAYEKSAEYALPDRDIMIGSHQARTARIISVSDMTSDAFHSSSIELDTGGYSTIEELNGTDQTLTEDNLADSGNSLDASESGAHASGQPGTSTSDVDSGIEGSSLTAVPVSEVVLGLPGEEDSSLTATTERIDTYLNGKSETTEVSVHSEGSTTPTTTNTISSIESQSIHYPEPPVPIRTVTSEDLSEVCTMSLSLQFNLINFVNSLEYLPCRCIDLEGRS